jgi:predicted nucleic acid-binding protein
MPARYVDASVFVHAYLKPRRELQPREKDIKKQARAIVARINRGEPVLLSAVHFAEIANILEDWMALEDAQAIQLGLVTMDNVQLLPVTRGDLLDAFAIAAETEVGTTDALAVVLMEREGTTDIYSFDRDFDQFDGLRRIAQ